MYSDLKRSFQNRNKFMSLVETMLRDKGTSLVAVQSNLGDNKTSLDKFLIAYYDSIAAVIVPIT